MCGIVFAQDFTGHPVNNGILQQFDKQRSRGVQGFGLWDGERNHLVHATKENKILKWLVNYDSSIILFHHRWPTSTINTKKAAHPFSTKGYFGETQYIMVHNGHINNSAELHKKHLEMGIVYQSTLQDGSYNDSEALLWDLALTLEGKQTELTARGQNALVCMKNINGKLDKLFFARNINPLNMFRDKMGIALSSEGAGNSIDANQLYTYNYSTKRLTQKSFAVPMYAKSWSKDWDDDYVPYGDSRYHWTEEDDIRYGTAYIAAGKPSAGYKPTEIAGAGRYLSDGMQRKFGEHLAKKEATTRLMEKYIEYDYDKDGNQIPFSSTGNECATYQDDDDELQTQLLDPDEGEVISRAFEYISGAEGNFEEAYVMAEEDYCSLLDWPETSSIRKEILLLEGVLDFISNDPENVDSESISSMWMEAQSWNLQVA